MMYLKLIPVLYCLLLKLAVFAQQQQTTENLNSNNDSELAEQLCILLIFYMLPNIKGIVLNNFYRHKTFQTEKSRTVRGY